MLGKGLFFGINSDSTLECFTILSERVLPEERELKLQDSIKTGPLYIECRIFFEIPSQCKGVLIAFQQFNNPQTWKLDIINRVLSNNWTMEILVWNGPVTDLLSEAFEAFSLYPSFFFQDMKSLISDHGTHFLW